MGSCFSIPATNTQSTPVQSQRESQQQNAVRYNAAHETDAMIVHHNPLAEADPTINFQNMLEGIYDAAVKAQHNVEMNNLHHLFWLFPQGDDGVHRPRTIKLQVPHDNGFRDMDVPLFTLLHQSHLTINELRLKTKLDLEMNLVPSEMRNETIHGVSRKKYQIQLIPGDKSTDIDIVMKIENPTEAYNRILHKYEVLL